MKCLAVLLVVCLSVAVSGQGNFVSSSRSSFSPSGSSSFSRQSNFVQSGSRPSFSSSSSFSPSGSSSFSRPSTSSFSQPQRSSGSPQGQSAENLCQLKNFAEDRCRSSAASCKRCIVDTVQRRCPYDSKSGPPDCNKLQACAKSISFSC